MASTLTVPSCTGYVATTVHALRLIHAAYQGIIPRIARPLNDAERRTMMKSGAVFVFSVEESGICQWTDGLLWSPAHIMGNFLVYRQIDDFQHCASNRGSFKPGALIKKSIAVAVEGSEMQLIAYYTIEDKQAGKLKRPSSRPDIMSLHMPPHIFRPTDFRVPPKVETSPDGKPYLAESEVDQLENQQGTWATSTQTLEPPANTMLYDDVYAFEGKRGSRWSMNGDSPRPYLFCAGDMRQSPRNSNLSADGHTAQTTLNSLGQPCLNFQDDSGIQSGHEMRTTPSSSGGLNFEDRAHNHRHRKPRAARDENRKEHRDDRMEAEAMETGIFANPPHTSQFIWNTLGPGVLSCPVQPWTYYPTPALMIMMPLPVIPLVPTFGPSQCANINSGNVINIRLHDVANNNSTNLSIRKRQEKTCGRGRKRHL